MANLDLEQLIEDAQANLDLDPRYFDQDEGAFRYYDTVVLFSKTEEHIILEVPGLVLTVARP